MSNAVRLVNGGTIQVRTGVLQGIGPQGPTGPVGPTGPDGPQGKDGIQGPIGQILQVMSKTTISSTTAVAADTDVTVAWGNVLFDDHSCIASSTNFTFNTVGDYLFTGYVRFDLPANPGDGHRSLWLNSGTNGVLHRVSALAIVDEATYVQINVAHRVLVAGETIQVKARSGDDLGVGISQGAMTITRLGSGPKGDIGPAGPQGGPGPTGGPGPKGDPGNASAGFATYGDLK